MPTSKRVGGARAATGARRKRPAAVQVAPTEAEELCSGLTGPIRGRALKLANHVLTLEKKLDDAQKYIEQMPPFFTQTYYNDEVDENGNRKRHTAIKPNPAIGVYQSMLATYCATLGKLEDMIAGTAPASDKGKSTLTRLRALNGNKSQRAG